MFEETKNLPTLSSFGSHLARKGLSRCWSKQYFEWSQDAEASLKKVKEEDGQMEMLMPELSLVKEKFRRLRGVSVLLKKAEMPDPWGRLWRGRNSEILASCRLSRFFWRENSRRSPVEEVRSANFTSKGNSFSTFSIKVCKAQLTNKSRGQFGRRRRESKSRK